MSTDPETKKIRDVNEGGRFQKLILTKNNNSKLGVRNMLEKYDNKTLSHSKLLSR